MRWGMNLSFGRVFLILGLAFAANPVDARQQSYIILDYDGGAVLDASEADERAYPASLTKMMTLYLTFRALDAGQITLKSRLRVSARAARMPPTKLGLKAGSTLRVEDAILGLVTRSANDAAAALAEELGGSESRFALLMTKTARRLGMSRTVFRNASGLPDRTQLSTARDLSRLAVRLIADYPRHYRYFSRKSFSLAGRTYGNHNRLLSSYPGMDGLKTGYTRASGFNLAASATRDGRRLVAVVLGGDTAQSRDDQMAGLLDAGFDELDRRGAADALVAMTEPSPPKPKRAAAVLAVAAAEGDADLETEVVGEATAAEVVVASLTAETAATMTDVPVPEPRIVSRAAVKKAALRTKPAAALKLARAKAATDASRARQAARAAAATRSAGQLFGVQVGAFQQPDAARNAARQAIRTAPDLLRGTFASVSSLSSGGQPLFRATLVGLDQSEAGRVCRLLKQKRQDCLVVRTANLTVAQR